MSTVVNTALSTTQRLVLLWNLALKDLWHDRKISLCIAAALVAVIAPLLLLFGLKHGVVTQLQEQLLRDPRNLQVTMTSSASYSPQWLQELRALPQVGFVQGLTRSLNAQADIQATGGRFVSNVELIPSAAGDPILASVAPPQQPQEVVLSAETAMRLGVQAQDTVRLRVSRRLNNREEIGHWILRVHAVLAPSQYERLAVFVHPDLLQQTEWFRDGFAVAQSGLATGTLPLPSSPRYARARIYAKSVDDVATLERWLQAQRIETSSQLAEIENVKAINYVLSLIFTVVSTAAALGCAASITGAFLANVDRKRRSLAVLRLMGMGVGAIAIQLVLQASVLSLLGFLVGLGFYGLGSQLFNQVLGNSSQNFICQITWIHALLAFLGAMILAIFVSFLGAWRANTIHPAESLREI